MINIRKWLKRLHRTNGDMSSDFLQQVPQHTVSDEVWTDLSIKINVCLMSFFPLWNFRNLFFEGFRIDNR